MDEAAFLRSIPPFDVLPRDRFEEAARGAVERRFAAGTWLAQVGGEPMQHLYVIRKGSVRLERHGQTVQVLEEGESFGYTSLITGKATLDVVVEEDLVACALPAAAFRRLEEDARFAAHFAAGLGERLRASLEHSPVAAFQPDLSGEALRLVRGPPVWVGAEATVVEAARTMRDRRISSVLVRTEPPAILTDRDLRNRVLAEGLGGDAPVAGVATRPLWTLPAETPVYEAWMALLDEDRHHLPLLRDGEVVGVVTSTGHPGDGLGEPRTRGVRPLRPDDPVNALAPPRAELTRAKVRPSRGAYRPQGRGPLPAVACRLGPRVLPRGSAWGRAYPTGFASILAAAAFSTSLPFLMTRA